jgi:hypothetical protein
MSIKVLELTKSNESVELSIDEQIQVVGGEDFTGGRYGDALKAYSDGKANISNKGDIVKIDFTDVAPVAYFYTYPGDYIDFQVTNSSVEIVAGRFQVGPPEQYTLR